MDSQTNETQPKFFPLHCPHCGSEHLVFVSEYHKFISFRIARGFVSFAIIILALLTIPNLFLEPDRTPIAAPFLIIAMIAWGFLSLRILVGESKTHTKVICRDCGLIWLID